MAPEGGARVGSGLRTWARVVGSLQRRRRHS